MASNDLTEDIPHVNAEALAYFADQLKRSGKYAVSAIPKVEGGPPKSAPPYTKTSTPYKLRLSTNVRTFERSVNDRIFECHLTIRIFAKKIKRNHNCCLFNSNPYILSIISDNICCALEIISDQRI